MTDPACACGGEHAPALTDPRPGLASLPLRTGTHGSFRAAMLGGMHGQPALARLTTREADDPAIALLDAWAVGLDILSFYGERIADEGFLRTATERRSVLELARLIAYELAPGASASTYLAVTCDDMAGAPATVTVPAGTGVMSVPAAGELPQTFETGTELVARPEWNALRAESAVFVAPQPGDTRLVLDGAGTRLRAGDLLLLVGDERAGDKASPRWQARKVVRITEYPLDVLHNVPARTEVELEQPLGGEDALPLARPRIQALRQRANLFGHNAPQWSSLPVGQRIGELRPGYAALAAASTSPADAHKLAERLDPAALVTGVYAAREKSWADAQYDASRTSVDLEQVFDGFVAHGWTVLRAGAAEQAYQVTSAAETSVTDYTLSQKVTRLTLAGPPLTSFSPRSTTAWGISEPLAWGLTPVAEPVTGTTLVLATPVAGLAPGRMVAVSGTRADTGATYARIVELQAVETVPARGDAQLQDAVATTTRLRFVQEIGAPLVPETVTVNANVVAATHGASREDAIGNGDGSAAFLRVKLPQKPLTYVSAPTGDGRRTTLEVRVNGIAWRETPSLLGAGPSDRVYTVRRADDGTVTVGFGDGATGARTPSGRSNLVARYRTGTGLAGNLAAGQISQAMQRPLGLRALANPLPAAGGEDPETLARARENAPLTVRAMGRVVSLGDVADFAGAFGGIAKARAVTLWSGDRRLVQLTVAGAGGVALAADDATLLNLAAALDAARTGDRAILVAPHRPALLVLSARLTIDPTTLPADVLAAAKAALAATFGFDARDFGQPASLSEAAATLHGVAGVQAVYFEAFHRADEPPGVAPLLPAALAGGDPPLAAELLTLPAANITLTQATP